MGNIVKLEYDSEFFNIKDTLECGQFFRYTPYKAGYLVNSLSKCCYCYQTGNNTVIECEEKDAFYFENFFDVKRDYSKIYQGAINENVEVLTVSATQGKGIRLLNQDPVETLFCFIISQNNNIPRIKNSIEKLCKSLGEKQVNFLGEYYAFPSIVQIASASVEFFKSIGLGYRAEYVKGVAELICSGFDAYALSNLSTSELKRKLIELRGVGPKVADCVALFGYKKSDSFPVDTWIEKVYKQDFLGTLNDREKISKYFTDRFKDNSGYYQQYLFHYKRNTEQKEFKKRK